MKIGVLDYLLKEEPQAFEAGGERKAAFIALRQQPPQDDLTRVLVKIYAAGDYGLVIDFLKAKQQLKK